MLISFLVVVVNKSQGPLLKKGDMKMGNDLKLWEISSSEDKESSVTKTDEDYFKILKRPSLVQVPFLKEKTFSFLNSNFQN